MRMLVLGCLTAVGTASAALAADRVVRVYNWPDYIDEGILADFTAETGIAVVYDTFESNEILEERLLAGNIGYDVVVPSGSFLEGQIRAGLFRPLDFSRLPNRVHSWDFITRQTDRFDPGGRYSVNYMWGTTGIGYNVGEVRKRLGFDRVETWDVVFEPEILRRLAPCGVVLLDAPTEILPAALNYLGHPPHSANPAHLAQAEALLRSIRPHVRAFDANDYIDWLATGEICLVVGWSGDVLQARDQAEQAGAGVEIGYVTPEEGALMWFDQMAIPADAPDPEAAHAFIDYILRPEVIARASNYVFYPNGNLAAQPLMDPEVRNDPAVYPPAEVMDWLYVSEIYPPELEAEVQAIWARITGAR